MTYIFTAPQLAGVIQQAIKTDDPLILENVAFLAELFYQDEKEDIKKLTDQPWPERLVDTTFEAYDYGAYEQDIRTNSIKSKLTETSTMCQNLTWSKIRTLAFLLYLPSL